MKALEEKQIAGAATDVYYEEPVGLEKGVLIGKRGSGVSEVESRGRGKERGLNGKLAVSHHIACCASASIKKLKAMVAVHIETWARGEGSNLVV